MIQQGRRHTALSDSQLSAAVPALDEMLADRHVAGELERLEDMFLMDDLGAFHAAAEALAGYCRAKDFAFARLYGRFLSDWIARAVCAWYLVRQGFTVQGSIDALRRFDALNQLGFGPERTERLTPDNPLGLGPNEAVVNARRATARDFMDLCAYFRSLEPQGQCGRPRGRLSARPGAAKAKSSGRKPVDPGQAKRALELSRLGLALARSPPNYPCGRTAISVTTTRRFVAFTHAPVI
jgi:hypothetical protein